MLKPGEVKFRPAHNEGATCIAFNPKDRYIYVSGGNDKKIRVNCAIQHKQMYSVVLNMKPVNGLAFTCDGSKVIATTCSRKVNVMDIETQNILLSYDDCCNPGNGRQPVASHPDDPYLAACATTNGRGISVLDLRMQLPLEFMADLHEAPIGDISFLEGSWPFGSGNVTLLSGGGGSSLKVTGLSGHILQTFPSITTVSAIAASPGKYNACANHGFPSVIISAGDFISCQVAGGTFRGVRSLLETFESFGGKVTRAKFSCSGGILYTATGGGTVTKYRRHPSHLEHLGDIITHKNSINDLAISPFDEYLVAACSDGSVGVAHLGLPSHGWTRCFDLT